MLDPSQANALVYSTLCGFMLIGLWAGYNTKNKREFISGVRTQSGLCPCSRSRATRPELDFVELVLAWPRYEAHIACIW